MKRLKIILQYKYIWYILFLISLILSIIRINIPIKIDINQKEIIGILEDYKIDGDKLVFIIKDNNKVRCTYYFKTEEEKLKFLDTNLGIKLKINGNLSIPKNNTIPNTFNYKKYLNTNNIFTIMNVDKVEIINNKTNIFYKIKNKLNSYLKKYKSKDYLYMFILGKKDYLNDEIYNQYQELGVSHIFAISGMHISLLTAIILKLLKYTKENIKYTLVILFLLMYLFLTNYQASIMRSTFLFIFLFLNKKVELELDTESVLLFTISFLLIINPYYINNIGFQYSSLVSYSLIKHSSLIKGNYLMKCLKISLIAMLYSLPITLYNNYEFNILSVINNLIYVPLISFIIYPLCLLTLIFAPLDLILNKIIYLLEIVSSKMLVFNIGIPKINILIIIIYYLIIFLFFNTYNKKILLLIPIMLISYKLIIMNKTIITYIDVGQGDSTLIKLKDKSILIDTGGTITYNVDEWKKKKQYFKTDNTIKYLKSLGINKLDYLILTHGDYDHMGESSNLVKNFKVKKVIFNCGTINSLEKNLIKELNKKDILYYSCINELNINKTKLIFLNTQEYDNENDNSNVIYLNHNNKKFLFMGDAGIKRENDILEQYDMNNIDFIKIGHHGSNTSSSENFINNINPKYSIISVGKNNRYGHPKDSVLETLKNSKIYRTDLDGSIEIKLNKNGYKIRTCLP